MYIALTLEVGKAQRADSQALCDKLQKHAIKLVLPDPDTLPSNFNTL